MAHVNSLEENMKGVHEWWRIASEIIGKNARKIS